jgi:glycosyl transferase family 1
VTTVAALHSGQARSAKAVPESALFVTHETALSGAPGGLQTCTREYKRTIETAGFELSILQLPHDRRLLTRLRQRWSADRYPAQWPPSAAAAIADAANRRRASIVFLNLVNLAPLAALVRRRLDPSCRIVLLSHGLESVDYLARAGARDGNSRSARVLGRTLAQEARHREAIDHVFCLAPFEVEIERWLGAASVSWLPRTIPCRPPLHWTPSRGRIGFVGTLDHHPNRDGLLAFLESLAAADREPVEVRIVGGPTGDGERIAHRWPLATYLGALDDAALEREAATWSCFVHPLFCYARGCSTKLATAMSWQIPIATTTPGRRGYVWSRGDIPVAETAAALAALALDLSNPERGALVRPSIAEAAGSSPRIDAVAEHLRASLAHLMGAPA